MNYTSRAHTEYLTACAALLVRILAPPAGAAKLFNRLHKIINFENNHIKRIK